VVGKAGSFCQFRLVDVAEIHHKEAPSDKKAAAAPTPTNPLPDIRPDIRDDVDRLETGRAPKAKPKPTPGDNPFVPF
jgi:hypothetical protein